MTDDVQVPQQWKAIADRTDPRDLIARNGHDRKVHGMLILLEPFHSALNVMGIESGILDISDTIDRTKLPFWTPGSKATVKSTLLQLLLLYEDVRIVYARSDYSQAMQIKQLYGYTPLSADALADEGLVLLEEPSFPPIPDHVNSSAALWEHVLPEIEPDLPIILSQLDARGKKIGWDLWEWFNRLALGDEAEIPARLPDDQRTMAMSMASDPESMMGYMLAFTGTASTLATCRRCVQDAGAELASSTMVCPLSQQPDPRSDEYMLRFMIGEFLGRNVKFVLPTSLREVVALRNDPAISDFRELFFQIRGLLLNARIEEAKEARAKILSTCRKFEHHHRVRALSELAGYATIPAALIDPWTASGLVVAEKGLAKLADRWRSQSGWLSLFVQD